jgi:hypothetical protein
MPKGGKRLLREALGSFRASQGQEMRDADKMPKGSKRLLSGEALLWDCSVLLKEKMCDAGERPQEGGKRLLREALGSSVKHWDRSSILKEKRDDRKRHTKTMMVC